VPNTPAAETYLADYTPFGPDTPEEPALPGLPATKVAQQGEPGRDDDRQFDGGGTHLEQARRKQTAAEGAIFRLSELEERDRRQGSLMLPIRGGLPRMGHQAPELAARNAAEGRWSSLACQKLSPEAVSAITQDLSDRATAAELAKPRAGWTGFNLVMRELRHVAA